MSKPTGSLGTPVIRVLLIEGAANTCILTLKLVVGLHTGSIAILGDALHSLTDLLNNVLAFFAARVAYAPPDPDHPYGHRKFEPLAVFALATLLSAVAVQIIVHAFTRLGEPIETSTWALATMAVVLVVNVVVSGWEAVQARKLESDLLRADASHTFSDVLITSAVIAGWQAAAHGYPWADPLLAMFVAVLVFYLAYSLFRRAVPALVDQAAANAVDVARTVNAIPDVREVRRIRSRQGGSGTVADVIVAVDGDLSTARSHEIANTIERALESKLGIRDVTVHIEPATKR